LGADFAVGEQRAPDPVLADDPMAVRAGLGGADRGTHRLLHPRRHRVLYSLRLLVDLVPGDPEDVGEEALDQAVAGDDRLGVAAPVIGAAQGLFGLAREVAIVAQGVA